MLGAFLALCAAFTFALNNATVRRGVLSGTSSQAMAITVPLGVPLFLLLAWPTGALALIPEMSPLAIFYLSLAGIVHFVWGRYCNYRATNAMGSNLVAPVQQWGLLIGLTIAVLLLGEKLTALRLLGIGLVLLGPMLTHGGVVRLFRRKKPTPAAAAANGYKPNLVEGYIFALLCATAYGSSPILVSLGLEQKSLTGSLAGGLISYIAAAAVTLLMLLWPAQARHVFATNGTAALWFTISGLAVWSSQLFFYLALAVAPVSVAMPILRLSMLFRIYLGKLLNPQHEVFGAGVIWGSITSLSGVLALSLSTDTVLALLAAPDWLVAVARWQWP